MEVKLQYYRSVGWSVCFNFLKEPEVSLPRSYLSTCSYNVRAMPCIAILPCERIVFREGHPLLGGHPQLLLVEVNLRVLVVLHTWSEQFSRLVKLLFGSRNDF